MEKTIEKLAFLLVFAAVMLAPPRILAQLTAEHAFMSAPKAVLPMLDRNTRLDMLDYHSSGMSVKSTNALRGKSAITGLSPETVSIEMTEVSDYLIAVLPPKNGADTLVAVIATMKTPAPDSKFTVYSSDWSQVVTSSVFVRPDLKDWLTEQGRRNRADVEDMVPFLLVSYAYDPSTRILTLTNNTEQFLSPEVYEIVRDDLRGEIKYTWNGRKFEKSR